MSDRLIFPGIVVARIIVAMLIVLPPLIGWQWVTSQNEHNSRIAAIAIERTARTEQTQKILLRNDALLARERIDRVIATCQSYNEQRIEFIATSEAVVTIAAAVSPPLDDRGRLLLAAFVIKANRQIEQASKPKTCTIAALKLQPFVEVIQTAKAHGVDTSPTTSAPSPTSGRSSPVRLPPTSVRSTPPTTVRRPPPHTTTTTTPPASACAKLHGRCHPKG
jgi:hypothetical protein